MATPLVGCRSCGRAWHSPVLADGLREIGRCPRCGGALEWAPGAEAAVAAEQPVSTPDVPPHLVFGVPRR